MNKFRTLVMVGASFLVLVGCSPSSQNQSDDFMKLLETTQRDLDKLEQGLVQNSRDLTELRQTIFDSVVADRLSAESLAKDAAATLPRQAWAHNWETPADLGVTESTNSTKIPVETSTDQT